MPSTTFRVDLLARRRRGERWGRGTGLALSIQHLVRRVRRRAQGYESHTEAGNKRKSHAVGHPRA
jgi:hypothetical protein